MKKKLCCFLFLISSILFSQQTELDSIKNVIIKYKSLDTTLVNLRLHYSKRKFILQPNDTTQLIDNLKTLELSKNLGYNHGIVNSYQLIGIYYQYIKSNPYKALDYYQKAMSLANEDRSMRAASLKLNSYLGVLYYELEEFKKAIPFFKDIVKNYASISSYENLGNIYSELKQNDSAIFYFNKALVEERKTNNYLYLTHTLSCLALVQSKTNQLDDAILNIEESLNLLNTHNFEILRIPVYLNASKVYMANSDLENAEKYAVGSAKLTGSLNNDNIQKSIWENLYVLHKEKKDYKEALIAFENYESLKDSLINNDRKLEISRKEIQFEADKEKLLSQNEATYQKTLATIAIAVGVLVLLAAFVGFLFYKKKQKSDFKAKVSEIELKVLRTQMNPHFIFNTLNSISDYINKNDIRSANQYLSKFSKLIRKTLESSMEKEVLLNDDIEVLKNYLDIEKKRLNNSFDYTITVDENLDVNNVVIPPLILQPFLENSIWHGLSQKENGHISIEFKKDGDILFCSVDDNGIGRKKLGTDTKENKSIGINLTKNRIDILNKKKNTHGNLKIIDKEEGVRVEVKLPLELAF